MRAKRVDANQAQIVKALISMGFVVADTSSTGNGFPDLVVGYQGVNYLIEVKDGKKEPSRQKLTKDQIKFHREWVGQIAVVNCIEQAIAVININLSGNLIMDK